MFSTWRTQPLQVEIGPRGDPEHAWLGRYAPVYRLGVGAFGEVWRATDLILEQDVAIKRLVVTSPPDVERLRRETTALRVARVPGVVHIRDDFRIGSEAFIVMDLVDGVPFGDGGPHHWDAVERQTRSLLATLARLHFAGLVHRDLKPTNILVDRAGNPVVLDLGVASGRGVVSNARPGTFEGTRYYAAPEQLAGTHVDARADMYALGAVLFEVLVGRTSRPDLSSPRSSEAGPNPRVPVVDRALDELPYEVAALLRRLLAEDPDERPDAVEALHMLGGSPPIVPLEHIAQLPHEASPLELRRLFHGPDVYLHLQEDAANVLYARTAGRRELVGTELDAWVRAGLASWEGGAARIGREAIGQLQAGAVVRVGCTRPFPGPGVEVLRAVRMLGAEATLERVAVAAGRELSETAGLLEALQARGMVWPLAGGLWGGELVVDEQAPSPERVIMVERALSCLPPDSDSRVRLLITAGAPWQETVEAVGLRCRELLRLGLYHDCLARVELAAGIAVARTDGTLSREVLASGIAAACFLSARYAVERMRLVLEQVGESLDTPEALLLRVAWLTCNNQKADARELIQQVAPVSHPSLEAFRVQHAVVLLREPDPAVAEDWLGSEISRGVDESTRLAAIGVIRYAQGRYLEAAEADELSVRMAPQARGWNNAVAARLELGDPKRALQSAMRAREHAALARKASTEARAHYLVRAARYRSGLPVDVDPDRTSVAAGLDPMAGVLHAVVDATVAWRLGRPEECGKAASMGLTWAKGGATKAVWALLRALFAWAQPADEVELKALAQEILTLREARVALQLMGLLASQMHQLGLGRADVQGVLERAEAGEAADRHAVRELMSIAEALQRLANEY